MTERSGPLRILVVDDEPAILRFLRAGLTGQGYQVIEAMAGHPALDTVRQQSVDLVVLDLGLPDIDGLEVIRRMRASGIKLPIVVFYPAVATRRRRSQRSISVPMIMSQNPSAWRSCSRGFARRSDTGSSNKAKSQCSGPATSLSTSCGVS
jgi:CheY-like chemotaxis protein